ncbi:hypothetical protein PR202_gb09107 [Eleusine coracana subsp. coracana]|uniref:Uncharacterized protein n=1 Tax=Eleusine coracana subsp. coracana TaxID=191504 RepID=A0AAV5EDX7_ELECO|nr:hypothetical protein PR202_gb09107 [Eleusine coracana subsp. coracana]
MWYSSRSAFCFSSFTSLFLSSSASFRASRLTLFCSSSTLLSSTEEANAAANAASCTSAAATAVEAAAAGGGGRGAGMGGGGGGRPVTELSQPDIPEACLCSPPAPPFLEGGRGAAGDEAPSPAESPMWSFLRKFFIPRCRAAAAAAAATGGGAVDPTWLRMRGQEVECSY